MSRNRRNRHKQNSRQYTPPSPITVRLPTIDISGRHMREITDGALKALKMANSKPVVFVRGGRLCRLRAGEDQRPLIEPFDVSSLRGRLERVANFTRRSKTNQPCPCPPPIDMVKDILSLESWDFPVIDAVVEVPVLRHDGTVLHLQGYDAASKLYYWQRPGFSRPFVPNRPTPEQVTQAVALLNEAIGDFPFMGEASKANAVALLLTTVARPAITGCVPLALIDAPQQGTGKSLIAKIISIISTGRHPAMMAAPNNDEEWRKRITSTLLGGASIITIDNLEGTLRSPSLASALSADVWQDRRLGGNETVEIAQRSTWMATGNNVRLGGDLQRRCYWIRLDARSAQPWRGRSYRHPDLAEWVQENRTRLVGALLTIARAWFVAGKPAPNVQGIGGFESWHRTIGGMLQNAGIGAFLGNLDEMYNSADDDSGEWLEFLTQIKAEFPSSFSAADVAGAAESNPLIGMSIPSELDNAWENRNHPGVSFAKRLGRAFANHCQRRYGPAQHRIEHAGDRQNAKIWRVAYEEVPVQQQAA
jgi:hypothetical protein